MVTGTLAKASAFVSILPCLEQASTFMLYNSSRGNSDPVNMAVVRQFIPAYLCPSAPLRRNIPTSGCDANDRAPGTYAFCTGSGDPWGTLAAGNPHNGEFEFSSDNGPVIANHRVEIEATDFQDFAIDDEAAFAAAAEATGESPVAVNPVLAIYNSQTTLTAIVKDMDGQSFMFGLKTEQ